MAVTVVADTAHSTTGSTEETVYTTSGGGVFQFVLDLTNITGTFVVTVYAKVLSAGTLREFVSETFSASTSRVVTIPVISSNAVELRVTPTTDGSGISIPYRVQKLASVTVEASGTTSITASNVALGSKTTNKTFVLVADPNNITSGATLTLRVKEGVRSGDSTAEQISVSIEEADKAQYSQSIPLAAAFGADGEGVRSSGTDFNLEWALLSVG